MLLEKEYATTTNEARQQTLEPFAGRWRAPSARRGCGRRPARCDWRERRSTRRPRPTSRRPRPSSRAWNFPKTAARSPQPITSEILSRLDFLGKVGLGYLTLDRPAETLSGGELQRVRLASGLGSGLVGVCYVLDEPSIGLHPRDNQRLIEALEGLQARGNTVLVVEHDEAIMRRADWLVDLGPGAGRHGGRIVAEGTPAEVAANPASLTGRYLAGTEKIPVPAAPPPRGDDPGDHHRRRDHEQPQERHGPAFPSRRWSA